MKSHVLTEEEYYKLFYRPEITPYDFFRILFAQLSLMGINKIPRNITRKLYELKNTGEYDALMGEVSFKDNGLIVYSDDVEDSISELQTMTFLWKPNPSYDSIYINIDSLLAEEVLGDYRSEIRKLIGEFAAEFVKGLNIK